MEAWDEGDKQGGFFTDDLNLQRTATETLVTYGEHTPSLTCTTVEDNQSLNSL